MRRFEPVSFFTPKTLYRFLPFRFLHWSASDTLLVNEVGEYVFLRNEEFTQFIQKSLLPTSSAYRQLKSRHFLTDSDSYLPITLLATKYRTKKTFLEGFTKLHLFVVTLRCDHRCAYCAASSVPYHLRGYDMDEETAKRAVDLMLCCPTRNLKVEFQGGEPLLNFDTVRFICEYSSDAKDADRLIDYVICSNLASLNARQLDFMKRHSMFVSTSLDGPQFIHDANRRFGGGSSYDHTVAGIQVAMAELGSNRVSALMTTTTLSLDHHKEIVDEYVKQGLNTIFLRSLRPYGRSGGRQPVYSDARFLSFYREAFQHILDLNRHGIKMVEGFARVVLSKILTPFATGYVDLQSPAGAGIGFVAYNYDGNVYASDEGRMLAEAGDYSFAMGDARLHSYSDIFGGPTIRGLVDSSCVETLPGCAECAFQAYCGADPVHNYVTQGDIVGHRPTSNFCRTNYGIIRLLLEYLRTGDDFTKRLLISWVSPHGEEGRC